MDISILDFIILALAAWRLSSLFADEDGPFDIFERLRTWLGVRYVSDSNGDVERYVPNNTPTLKRNVARGIICRWCNSVWFSTLLAVLYIVSRNAPWHIIIMAFALSLATSTATILVDNTMSGTAGVA